MVTSMIPSVDNVFKNPNIIDMRFLSSNTPYNPLINYDWSTTTASGLRYLKDTVSTPTYNASMYFGRGVYFNGVDQGIYAGTANLTTDSYSIVITTVNRYSSWYSTAIQADNGASVIGFTNTQNARFRVLTTEILSSSSIPINTPTTLIGVVTNNIGKLYVNGILDSSAVAVSKASWNNLYIGQRSGNTDYYRGTCKDVFIFSRALTQAEITQAYEQPEAFYAMAQADSTCVLNMPMCETSSTVRNYKTGIDYPISNYTSSARDNAKNLQYGLQTCKFVRNSLGIIQSASNYLECNGTGYAIIPSHTDKVNIKMTVNPTSLSGNLLSGGVTKTLTGLTLNVDNDVVINDITPTGAITLASGFSGTIKTYTEELV